MLFSAQLPLASLIEMCRALRHNLGAGLTARDVFRQLTASGSKPLRPVCAGSWPLSSRAMRWPTP